MSASMKYLRFVQAGLNAAAVNASSLSKVCGCQLSRYYSAVAEVKQRTWQLHSAVCLQRHPVISAQANEIEAKYRNYLEEVEVDQSLLSNHELHIIADKLRKEKKHQEGENEVRSKHLVEESLLSAEEMEDEWQKELDKFSFASRITDADKNNDRTTPNRRLDKRLVLITKVKWDKDSKSVWLFPQVLREEGESMREAAERALKGYCGESVQATYIGNAPCGYHKYNLPHGKDSKGVKLFFFKANYSGGDVTLVSDNVLEYQWVSLDELQEYLEPSYLDDVNDFLIDI